MGVKKIEIRAIGGFAMMYYGFRSNGYTIDIDSLTKSFDENILKLIHDVGRELDLDEDWLNNDCALLEGFLSDLSNKIEWIDSKYKFNNIDLKIADAVGLLRSKAKAIQDGGAVPRSTDKKDLLSGLKKMKISDIQTLDKRSEFSFIANSYPRCYEFLKTVSKW